MIYNPYPSIELPFGKDNKYFMQLFDAICMVNEKYIRYSVPSGEGRYQYVSHLERVFAYELYRHWGNILFEQQEELVLNGEIDKIININGIELVDEKDDNNMEHRVSLYPDIVLHHSQSDDSNQLLICEIKRNRNLDSKKIFADLYKLSCYMTQGIFGEGRQNFKYGVFLVVDADLSVIKSNLKDKTTIIDKGKGEIKFSDYVNNDKLIPSFSKMVCVAYDGIKLEYQTLQQLIENNNEKY